MPVMDETEDKLNVKAQEFDEAGSSTTDQSIQVREVVIERPMRREFRKLCEEIKHKNEDSTPTTVAKPVDDVKGPE